VGHKVSLNKAGARPQKQQGRNLLEDCGPKTIEAALLKGSSVDIRVCFVRAAVKAATTSKQNFGLDDTFSRA
jgi:hypothetical protein